MTRAASQPYGFILIAAFSLAGCVSVSIEKNFLARRFFALDVRTDAAPIHANATGVLKVSNLRVSPRYEGKSFVYRTGAGSYETDFYNQFTVSPGLMLTDEVRQGLAQAKVFQYVVNPASQLDASHLLEGTVEALYGDFSANNSAQAVLIISFLLSREAAAGPEVIFQKRYNKTMPLQNRTPEALVRGWNQALEEILAAFVADLKATKF